jgi:hypothetical protein
MFFEQSGLTLTRKDWTPFRTADLQQVELSYDLRRLGKPPAAFGQAEGAPLSRVLDIHQREVFMWNWLFGSGWR